MSICHHLQARKVEIFNFWKQTANLNLDWGLLLKKINFFDLQVMANSNHCLEMLLILCDSATTVLQYELYFWICILYSSKPAFLFFPSTSKNICLVILLQNCSIYGYYSRGVRNQEWVILVQVWLFVGLSHKGFYISSRDTKGLIVLNSKLLT